MLNLTDFCTLVILRKTLLWHLLGYYWWFFFFTIIMRDPTVASIAALSPLALLKHPSIICRSRTPKNSSGLTFQVLRKGVILANPFWGRAEKKRSAFEIFSLRYQPMTTVGSRDTVSMNLPRPPERKIRAFQDPRAHGWTQRLQGRQNFCKNA